MRVYDPYHVWYALFRKCLGRPQYAIGRYAVRKMLSFDTQNLNLALLSKHQICQHFGAHEYF